MKDYHIKIEYMDRGAQTTGVSGRDNAEAIGKVMNSLTPSERQEVTAIKITYISQER